MSPAGAPEEAGGDRHGQPARDGPGAVAQRGCGGCGGRRDRRRSRPRGRRALARHVLVRLDPVRQWVLPHRDGVATGYQAIRYATGLLFPDKVPDASDFEIAASGPMRGLGDVLDLYAGPELERPRGGGEVSLQSFTFTARRVSTGRSMSFRLREGLIPQEFFALKNQGLGCDHPDVKRLKERAARKVLSMPPGACFEHSQNESREPST